MSSHALSDDQVAGELKKMTAFIRQEALEKQREIQIKADEEFSIEKSKLVQQEKASIDSSYERKFKAAQMSQQIAKSTVNNKTRLKVLGAKQELVDDLYEQAGKKLKEVSKDKKKYQEIMKGLILEGAYAMNEKSLVVRVKSADADVTKKAIDAAKKEYTSETDKEVEFKIDDKTSLPSDSYGGAIIIGSSGKIEIKNTLEQRLHHFRRRMAALLFHERTSLIDVPVEQLLDVPEITAGLKHEHFFIRPGTNYIELAARFSMLDTLLDGGIDKSRVTKDVEKAFNKDIDKLAEQINHIASSIFDAGVSYMHRMEAKSSIERIYYRILFTVRTVEQPRQNIFGERRNRDMKDFLRTG